MRVGHDDRLLVRSSHGQRHHDGDEEGGEEELHIVFVVLIDKFERVCQVDIVASRGKGDLLQCGY